MGTGPGGAAGLTPTSSTACNRVRSPQDERTSGGSSSRRGGYLGELEVCKKLYNLLCGNGANLAFEIHTLGVQRPANTPTW
jgi:hypothetical protein